MAVLLYSCEVLRGCGSWEFPVGDGPRASSDGRTETTGPVAAKGGRGDVLRW